MALFPTRLNALEANILPGQNTAGQGKASNVQRRNNTIFYLSKKKKSQPRDLRPLLQAQHAELPGAFGGLPPGEQPG